MKNVDFEAKKYQPAYEKHLKDLRNWEAFSKHQVTTTPGARNLTKELLSELLVKAR